MSQQTPDLPFISVVMPVYNEAGYIERSVGAMLDQDYPAHHIEIIVVDGGSSDGTREIVEEIVRRDSRVRLINNPRRIIPAALNLGIAAARYDLVARMDGHAIAAPDYLLRCVQVMQGTGADNVGGRWIYRGEDFTSSAIAAAMDSRFGVGTSRWRGSPTGGQVDTVPYGFYRRQLLLDLNGFDEVFRANEDYELNYRLRLAGGRIFYSPDILMTYFVRSSLIHLGRQYSRYGFWKARMIWSHPGSVRLRHLLAPLLVAGLAIGLPLSYLWGPFAQAYVTTLVLYILLSMVFSLRQAGQHGWRYLPLLPLIFAVLHISWGVGFLVGLAALTLSPKTHRQ